MSNTEIDGDKELNANFVVHLANENLISDKELLSALPCIFSSIVKDLKLNYEAELEKFKAEADKYYKWRIKWDEEIKIM